MNRLRAIVVDDEPLARRGLGLRLAGMPQVEVVAECANGAEALRAIAEQEPDLVFLDIQMPGLDGFDVICELQSDSTPMIIFVTAFDQYAVDAFRVHAVDYLLKPIELERLHQAVQRAEERHRVNSSTAGKDTLLAVRERVRSAGEAGRLIPESDFEQKSCGRLTIKDGAEYRLVSMADIQWIDAAGDYMCVHTADRTHIMRTTMKQLAARLDPGTFLRIHRSTIVNVNFVAGARAHANGEYLVTMTGGATLKVSRGHSDSMRSLLNA